MSSPKPPRLPRCLALPDVPTTEEREAARAWSEKMMAEIKVACAKKTNGTQPSEFGTLMRL
jgi:hypothetical protein